MFAGDDGADLVERIEDQHGTIVSGASHPRGCSKFTHEDWPHIVRSSDVTASLLVAVFLAFTAATVDNLIIVTALFTSSRATGRPRPGSIVAGQYIGFAAIVGASLVAAAGLRVIPDRWVGLVGFIPIAVGVRGLWRLRGSGDDSRPPPASTVAAIAMVIFANGADDIAVYAPLFRSLQVISGLVVAAEFLLLIGLWCAVGALLGTRRAVVATLGRTSHWLVPLVFIAIGIVILANGALSLTGDAR